MSINIKSPHEYLNATVVGTPTISEGVVSGFSSGNYLRLPEAFNPESNSWEMQWKFTTGSDVTYSSGDGKIICFLSTLTSSSSGGGVSLDVYQGKIRVTLDSTASSLNIANYVSVADVVPNTVYYIKLEFTGNAYNFYISNSSIFEETPTYTFSSSSTIYNDASRNCYIGGAIPVNKNYFTGGSIDLNQSYIKINGEYWWRGVEVDQYKEIKRLYQYDKPRYFKNVTEVTYEDWTQPTLSTDGTVGGDSYACRADSEYKTDAATYQAYKAFDKNTGTFWSSSSKTSAWLEFYSPVAILPTKVTLTNRSSATNPFKNVTVTGSLDGSEYFTLATYTNANSSNSAAWDIVIDNPQTVKYVRVAGSGLVTSNTLSQAEMLVTATQEIVTTSTIEVTANDEYDFIEFNPITIKQVYKTDKTKYYKYVTEVTHENWTQPTLSANGTIGGESFAVSATSINASHYAWYAFDKNTSTVCQCKATSGTFSFYNPVPLNITKLVITGYNNDWRIQNCTFSGSNDDANWEVIATYSPYFKDLTWDTPNDKYYKYFKIDWNRYGSYGLNWKSLDITATQEISTTIAVESTIDDHDYSELIPQLVYEHNPTVFQQSTAGTYTFNVTEEAPYEITLVGGGGGGAFNSSGNAGSAAAGNSGSGLVVNAVLKAGTYVLNVGAGGAWSGWLDANTWGGNGSQSSISKDGVVLATAGGGTGNHCWWRSGSAHNSTVGAAPTYTDEFGVRDVILNRQGNWGGLAATSSGGASVISGTTWGKGGDTRNRNAADNGNAGCIRIVRLEK